MSGRGGGNIQSICLLYKWHATTKAGKGRASSWVLFVFRGLFESVPSEAEERTDNPTERRDLYESGVAVEDLFRNERPEALTLLGSNALRGTTVSDNQPQQFSRIVPPVSHRVLRDIAPRSCAGAEGTHACQTRASPPDYSRNARIESEHPPIHPSGTQGGRKLQVEVKNREEEGQ